MTRTDTTPAHSGRRPVPPEAPFDCPLCPRLVAFHVDNRAAHPDWFNGPVPSFGDPGARLLIVGLAPGLQGANRTGRPFTGDYAGDLLYATLADYGFTRGQYASRPDDGLALTDCMITNAVRCVPPQNKPTGAEAKSCRPFLSARIAALPALREIIVLGRVAHDNTLAALHVKKSAAPFGHGATHALEAPDGRALTLTDSYHCSRYNTNTGRLTPEMFADVFSGIRQRLDARP